MKKFLTAFLCGILSLSAISVFAACSSGTSSGGGESDGGTSGTAPSYSSGNSSTETSASDGAASEGSASSETPPQSDASVLVVYFSAQGHTEAVANYIAEATGGDVFELVPVDEYTAADLNWNDDDSRVVREHEDESLRDIELVSATVDNWAEYDVVFIGYPIWWGIAAWPVNGFVEANDFTDKNVVPFCTSSSSGLGESGRLLADMAGEGNWLTGHRFRSGASESDVRDWLEDLGVI